MYRVKHGECARSDHDDRDCGSDQRARVRMTACDEEDRQQQQRQHERQRRIPRRTQDESGGCECGQREQRDTRRPARTDEQRKREQDRDSCVDRSDRGQRDDARRPPGQAARLRDPAQLLQHLHGCIRADRKHECPREDSRAIDHWKERGQRQQRPM
jgi:hypothetical protein